MEIKRLGENKIRCALTESEIQEMGFDIEEIIGNSETTQKFMRVVLGLVEQQENIRLDGISPMVKAELLQDHSMAITFGGESEQTFKSLVDTVNQLMSKMDPEKLEEFHKMSRDKKQDVVDEFLDHYDRQDENKKQGKVKTEKKAGSEPMTCALRFHTMNDLIRMCKVCFPDKVPRSSLYKMEDGYYLLLDFKGFTKAQMRPFAFGTVEYDNGHFSEASQIAHITEQGTCIVKKEVLQMLMQL